MKTAETVEANLQNTSGVVSVEKQYKKYVRYVVGKHRNNHIFHASLNL
jgi:hypothetical protein